MWHVCDAIGNEKVRRWRNVRDFGVSKNNYLFCLVFQENILCILLNPSKKAGRVCVLIKKIKRDI